MKGVRIAEALLLGLLSASVGALVAYWLALRSPLLVQTLASLLGGALGWAWSRPLVAREEPGEHESCKLHVEPDEEP